MVDLGKAALLAALVLLASCRSFFDSYLPESLEYLENQTSLVNDVGGSITSVKLGFLPQTAYNPRDQLVAIAYLADGTAKVLFYDPVTLQVRRKVSDAELRAVASGDLPALQLVAQDTTGLHTGWVEYGFSNLSPSFTIAGTLAGTIGSGGLSSMRAAFDGSNTVVFGQMGSNLGYQNSPSFGSLGSLAAQTIASSSSVSLLDFASSGGNYYLLAYEDATAHLVRASVAGGVANITLPANVVDVQPPSFDPGGGWATATAAIVQSRIDKTYLLRAYSWSGKDLGTVLVNNSGHNGLSLVFDPSGTAWFSYDPGTGLLSRQKEWW